MKVKSYESKAKKLLFVLVPDSSDVSTLPAEVKAHVGELVLSKEFVLNPDEPRLALDVKEALKDLQSKGYHLNQASITTTVRAGSEHGPILEQRKIP